MTRTFRKAKSKKIPRETREERHARWDRASKRLLQRMQEELKMDDTDFLDIPPGKKG